MFARWRHLQIVGGRDECHAGVAELDEYELLGRGAAVGVVVVRPEEDPEDPP